MNDIDTELLRKFHAAIDTYPDFPTEGILFRDISPLYRDTRLLDQGMAILERRFNFDKIDIIVGIEARGFPIATLLAKSTDKPMVMARKSGKLPGQVKQRHYGLEYGDAAVEIQVNAIIPGKRVLIIDDLLSTGGTAQATSDLVRDLGAEVSGIAFLVELFGLNGRDILSQSTQIESLITLPVSEK